MIAPVANLPNLESISTHTKDQNPIILNLAASTIQSITTLSIPTPAQIIQRDGNGRNIMRRVVVTGLGAITPLGVGIRRTWTRLLAGDSGITSLTELEPTDRWKDLTSTVAGIVPEGGAGSSGAAVDGKWNASEWLEPAEQRRMSRFTQYAVAAGDMALKDAGLDDASGHDRENTGVCLGSGIGNLEEIYDTSLAHQQGVGFVYMCLCPYLTSAYCWTMD